MNKYIYTMSNKYIYLGNDKIAGPLKWVLPPVPISFDEYEERKLLYAHSQKEKEFEQYVTSLPKIEVVKGHDWQDQQIVVEGEQFEFKEYEEWVYDNIMRKSRVAVPIVKPNPLLNSDLNPDRSVAENVASSNSDDNQKILTPKEILKDSELFYYRNILNPYPNESPSYTGYKKGFTEAWQFIAEHFKGQDLPKEFSTLSGIEIAQSGENTPEGVYNKEVLTVFAEWIKDNCDIISKIEQFEWCYYDKDRAIICTDKELVDLYIDSIKKP